MLTATGVNAPKSFPKTPGEILKKQEGPRRRPMTKDEWEAAFAALTGGAPPLPKDAAG